MSTKEQESSTAAAQLRCPFCGCSGRCFKCEGKGVRNVAVGRLKRKYAATCYACSGSGECQLCHGSAASRE